MDETYLADKIVILYKVSPIPEILTVLIYKVSLKAYIIYINTYWKLTTNNWLDKDIVLMLFEVRLSKV